MNPGLIEFPAGLMTSIGPDAPPATTAVMVVEFTTVKDDAGVPPKRTEVTPLKLAPEIVTVCPVAAEEGVKNVICGSVVLFFQKMARSAGHVMAISDRPSPFQSAAKIPILHPSTKSALNPGEIAPGLLLFLIIVKPEGLNV